MKISAADERTEQLVASLLNIWESSVKATHLFLSENEIQKIKEYVPAALKEISNLIIIEETSDKPVAFMGIEGNKIEMLFVAADERGKGFGKALIQYGIKNYAVNEVTVNEQNPLAIGFYEHLGFKVHKRTPVDEQGNPYPLLYMQLQ